MSKEGSFGWRFRNSLWIVWSLFLSLGWIGFLIAGSRARKRLWVYFGIFYLIVWLLPFLVLPYVDVESVWADIMTAIALFQWIPQLIHLCILRKPYLKRRAEIASTGDIAYKQASQDDCAKQAGWNAAEEAHVKSKLLYEKAVQQENPVMPVQSAAAASAKEALQSIAAPQEKVNLNTCDEATLLTLPGIGAVCAKKALALRAREGGFSSVSDFCERLSIAPHFAKQLQALATAENASAGPPQNEPFAEDGRLLDV